MKFRCILFVMAVLLASCGSSPAVSGLMGLDAALDGAAQDIESRLPSGTPIVITAITAPNYKAREFIVDELTSRFKNLKTLARESALNAVTQEQDFQMSGLVSDESAVGIGHFIGARAVISGTMETFADFTQLRLRIVDVETSETFIYSAKIANNDRFLENIIPLAVTAASKPTAVKVSQRELNHLNKGNDLLAERKFDEAIKKFDQAIAANSKMAEAYFGRGIAYWWKYDHDRAIAELNQAIQINPNYAEAYNSRGRVYAELSSIDAIDVSSIGDINQAIADYTSAIRINPNYAEAYYNRGVANHFEKECDNAKNDYTSAIQNNPNHALAYEMRGELYLRNGDLDSAIADYTQAIQINPNSLLFAHMNRGEAYARKGDYDRAIADFTSVLQSTHTISFHGGAYFARGEAYEKKGDIDRTIADYESAMRLGYVFLQSTIDRLKQQRR